MRISDWSSDVCSSDLHGGLLQVLATADPPAHTLHRRAVFPDLVAKRMAAMAPEIEQVADDCIDQLLRAGSGDFMAIVANPLPFTVVSKLVGLKIGRANV